MSNWWPISPRPAVLHHIFGGSGGIGLKGDKATNFFGSTHPEEAVTFYHFNFNCRLSSHVEVVVGIKGDPQVTGFNRRVRERLQDTPRRHPKLAHTQDLQKEPLLLKPSSFSSYVTAVWYWVSSKEVVLSAPRTSFSSFHILNR